MGDLSTIISSFAGILHVETFMWIFAGTLIGMAFGAAPGLTATTAVALFTPVTYHMTVINAFAFLLGIYCSGYYSGSIPAILIRTPGAAGNVATVMDGYPMACKGRAGEALMWACFSSWIGGLLSAVALLIFAPIIASFALKFGSHEYFAVGLLGLGCVAGISADDLSKGFISCCLGLFVAMIGLDPLTGLPRFIFLSELRGGVQLLPAAVGLFAVSEILNKVNKGMAQVKLETGLQINEKVKFTAPDIKKAWANKWLLFKSSVIGIIVGAIPGTGPAISSWLAYNEAKRTSKTPHLFGTGIPEGVMATESSNNAVTGGALIPMITLGIPGDPVTAVMLGALMIQGLTPGPTLVAERYDLVAMMLWILLIANTMMFLIGLLGNRFFPLLVKFRWEILLPIIITLCVTGSFGANYSFFDVKVMLVAGLIAFFMQAFKYPLAPALLGIILGPIIESNFRRAMMVGGLTKFFTRPLSCSLLVLTVVMIYFMATRMKGIRGE